MTLNEIIEFCSDEYNLQFTFDYSVFWMLTDVPNFFKIIQETIYRWDLCIDKYLDGEVITVAFNNELFAVSVKFDTNSKTFIISN